MHHIRQGSGPPLMLIPGTACDHRVWRPVLAPLSATREVIALDLPGFGATPPLDVVPTPGALAAAVAAFLDELDLGPVDVAGSSLGAAVAIELVRLGRARTACALAPIGLWTPRESAWVQALVRSSAAFIRGPVALRHAIADHTLLRTLGYGHVVARPWALSAADARALSDVAIPGFEAIADAYRDYRLPRFDGARVTVVWGTRDRLLLPRQAARVGRVLPRARVVRLDGAGHLPMFDAPAQVAALLLGGERPGTPP